MEVEVTPLQKDTNLRLETQGGGGIRSLVWQTLYSLLHENVPFTHGAGYIFIYFALRQNGGDMSRDLHYDHFCYYRYKLYPTNKCLS